MAREYGREVDVVVVGGGAAGLNGALMLARSRRSVAVIDSGQPRNAPAHQVHGLFAHDGTPPAELLARGRAEVLRYGGEVLEERVVATGRDGERITVDLAGGERLLARRLLVATGLIDILPDVPGLADHWGGQVVHCPFCHGWEVRDQAIGVLATSPMSVHQALMFAQLTDDLVFFAHEQQLSQEQRDTLAALDIRLVEGRVAAVISTDGQLTGVELADGSFVQRQALAVGTRLEARVDFLQGLGVTALDHPSGVGRHLAAGPTGQTETPGVWAAGNVTDLMAQVGGSAAAGAMAGSHIHGDLIAQDTARRLAQFRSGRTA